MGELAGCASRPGLRIERVEPRLASVAVARRARDGFVALKTIAAYRGGLRPRSRAAVLARSRPTRRPATPLPVQVHTGFGDPDLFSRGPTRLPEAADRAVRDTPFVLLHCYPFIREAGWLAHVYANVYFDLSLTIPYVSRPAEALREALELAPVSKLLYASDAARTPELYFLGAAWWREALARCCPSRCRPTKPRPRGARSCARTRSGSTGLRRERLGVAEEARAGRSCARATASRPRAGPSYPRQRARRRGLAPRIAPGS